MLAQTIHQILFPKVEKETKKKDQLLRDQSMEIARLKMQIERMIASLYPTK